jgi:arylamine N-acetyltransferase
MCPVDPLPADVAASYLDRLQVAAAAPTLDLLHAVHRAQVERIPYENLDIYRGVPVGIDPVDSARRFVGGAGGYCYHHNGALSALLASLGFRVTRHLGAVRAGPDGDLVAARGNHLVLTVEFGPGDLWLVDCGLGDLLYEPVPVRPGRFRQGPFGYELLDLGGGWWRVLHDPAQKSFHDMTFDLAPVGMEAFADYHDRLSTAPDSGFVTRLTLARRLPDAVDVLRGRVRIRHDGTGRHERTIQDADTWFAAMAAGFGLSPGRLSAVQRDALWQKATEAHLGYESRTAGEAES